MNQQNVLRSFLLSAFVLAFGITASNASAQSACSAEHLLAQPSGTGHFQLPSRSAIDGHPTIPSVTTPQSLSSCAADFNGDGFLDFIDFDEFVVAFESGSMNADFDADGFLTFLDFDAFVSAYETGCQFFNGPLFPLVALDLDGRPSFGVTASDFDGDGSLDVAVAYDGINSDVRVFQGLGNGTFGSSISLAVNGRCQQVLSADIDNDSRPDLVVVTYDNTIGFFRNTSTGSGTLAFGSGDYFGTSFSPSRAAISDIDGDGRRDLVIACAGTTSNVLRNTSVGPGSISFAAKINLPVIGSQAVAVDDLNGDNKPDVVFVSSSQNSIYILQNDSPSPGSVAFKPTSVIGASSMPMVVAIGDIDQDSKPDLVVANRDTNSVGILRNNTSSTGTISFASRVDLTSGPKPSSVVIADFDLDGRLDLAIGHDNHDNSGVSATIDIFFNSSAGSGNISFEQPSTKLAFPAGQVLAGGFSNLAAGDFNGDGLLEIVATLYEVKTFIISNLGSRLFGTRVDMSQDTVTSALTVLDADLDGRLDLAECTKNTYQVRLWRNVSTPVAGVSFVDAGSFEAGIAPGPVVVSDFDLDGKSDLAVLNTYPGTGGNSMSILRNSSSTPGVVAFASKQDYSTGYLPKSLAIGDFDGDGKPDLSVVRGIFGDSELRIYRNTSPQAGGVLFSAVLGLATVNLPTDVATGDLDGDGKLDVAVTNLANNTVDVFRNVSSVSGGIGFASKIDFSAGDQVYSIAIADIDADGKPDLLVANYVDNGTVRIFRNNSGGPGNISFESPRVLAVASSPRSIRIADVDADGKLDIVVASYGPGVVSVIRNTSSPTSLSFVYRTDYWIGANKGAVAVGDFDGDGYLDLAVGVNLSNYGGLSILRNQKGRFP